MALFNERVICCCITIGQKINDQKSGVSVRDW